MIFSDKEIQKAFKKSKLKKYSNKEKIKTLEKINKILKNK